MEREQLARNKIDINSLDNIEDLEIRDNAIFEENDNQF